MPPSARCWRGGRAKCWPKAPTTSPPRSGAICGGRRRARPRPLPAEGSDMAKILIVEDNEMNRDMLSRRLVRRGYAVAIASDGESGVAIAAIERPDLILMDMSLPGMAGDRDKALAAGCDDYDTKPVELPRLIGKIETLLGRGSACGRPDEGTPS